MTLEAIARQQFSLNRTTRLARQRSSAAPDHEAVDQYVVQVTLPMPLGLAQGLEQATTAPHPVRCRVMRKTVSG
jgi:hypothetical protein